MKVIRIIHFELEEADARKLGAMAEASLSVPTTFVRLTVQKMIREAVLKPSPALSRKLK